MENEEKEVDNCEMEKKEVIYGHAGDDSIDEDESTEEETCGFALLIQLVGRVLGGWVGWVGWVTYQLPISSSLWLDLKM